MFGNFKMFGCFCLWFMFILIHVSVRMCVRYYFVLTGCNHVKPCLKCDNLAFDLRKCMHFFIRSNAIQRHLTSDSK